MVCGALPVCRRLLLASERGSRGVTPGVATGVSSVELARDVCGGVCAVPLGERSPRSLRALVRVLSERTDAMLGASPRTALTSGLPVHVGDVIDV